MASRRLAIKAGIGMGMSTLSIPVLPAGEATGNSATGNSALAVEDQRSDPDLPYEHLTFDADQLATLRSVVGKKGILSPYQASFPAKFVEVAGRYVGWSRDKTPTEVDQLLQLVDLRLKYPKSGSYVPYCAAGLTYAAAIAYRELTFPNARQKLDINSLRAIFPELELYYFGPTPSCEDMYHLAAGKRRWRPHEPASNVRPSPKPGWVVLFSWGRGFEHCGVVLGTSGQMIETIEFNTTDSIGSGASAQRNGGVVARRTRPYDTSVRGFIATDAPPRLLPLPASAPSGASKVS